MTGNSRVLEGRRRSPRLLEFYGSAIGKKYAMAVSGVVAMGFIAAHMLGNLKIYLGAEQTDHYAHWLRESLLVPLVPEHVALWMLRIVLIAALVVHLHAAASLTAMNRRARGSGHAGPRDRVAADFAARTMRWTGIIVLLYLVLHLADLTWGIEPAATGEHVHGDVHANVVASFSRPIVAGAYVVANLALGVHLYHGVWSLFQSLGFSHRRLRRIKRPLAVGFTLLVVGANVSFPLAVLTGIVS
jgi:succinate dehydrogenase / fumarate reductase, cytochrome b subunit